MQSIWPSWNWILKLKEDDEDAGAAFITDQWLSERGSPGRCIRSAWQEAILKWGAFPRALSHPWHLDVCARVSVHVFWVKGGGSCFRPETRLPPLPCYFCPPTSIPACHGPSSIGPCFSFAYSFKSTNCLLRSNMGLRQGGASGPSAGVQNTETTRWRRGRDGGCPDLRRVLALNGFPLFLFLPLSLFFLTDALLTGVVLRLGSAARLTLLLSPRRGPD